MGIDDGLAMQYFCCAACMVFELDNCCLLNDAPGCTRGDVETFRARKTSAKKSAPPDISPQSYYMYQ
jgi:hypothetical protein